MRGLDPRIHRKKAFTRRRWIAGSSPAMTVDGSVLMPLRRRPLQRYRREIMLTPRRLKLGPPHDLELTIEVLDHGGAAFDPIATIDVAQPEIITDHGVMDVPPNDSVQGAPPPRLRRQRALLLPAERHPILDFQLRPFRQRPVG